MKIISNLKFAVLAIFAIISVSCLDDAVTDFGNGPRVVQFEKAELSQNFLQDGTGIVYDFKVPAQYFGSDNTPLNEDVTLTVAVVESLTTATLGQEFSLPETKFTIPAGSNLANVLLKVNSANLDALNPKIVALEIIESSQSVSSNKQIIQLTLQAICPSALAGEWVYTDGNGVDATIEETGSGTYTISRDNRFGAKYPINISDVCGNLKITGGFLQDNFGIAVSGTGTVTDNTITLSYTVDGYFDGRTMTLTKK